VRDLTDLLPFAVQVDTGNKALLLAAAAIRADRMISLRSVQFGRWEVRARDGEWLNREAKKL